MKLTTLFLACIVLLQATSCMNNNSKVSTSKAKLVSSFPAPKGWQEETINFPIEFAPQINYAGTEHLRFAPGWDSVGNETHWTYTFLWWLNDQPSITSATLQENLTQYYRGLVGKNIRERMIPPGKVTPIVVSMNETNKEENDEGTFKGMIKMTDYLDFNYNSITLNVTVHERKCGEHKALIFQISPQPFEHPVWTQLNDILKAFYCATE